MKNPFIVFIYAKNNIDMNTKIIVPLLSLNVIREQLLFNDEMKNLLAHRFCFIDITIKNIMTIERKER